MAVYTNVSDAEIAAFLRHYDLGNLVSLTGIAEGIENSNFQLCTDHGAYILTLYERRVDAGDLPYYLGLMDHLAARGLPCPTPIHDRGGGSLRSLCGKNAAIVTLLEGAWPRNPTGDECFMVGQALARTHIEGQDFHLIRPNTLSVSAWGGILNDAGFVGDTLQAGLTKSAQTMVADLVQCWPENLPTGPIHADLFPDNVFFQDGELSGLIDFYFACTDALAYDVAVTLNAWCFSVSGEFMTNLAARFLQGYNAVRVLTSSELDALPTLAQGAAMRFFVTRLYDWTNTPADALVVRKDPMEFWHRACFHANVKSTSDYGWAMTV